MKVSILGCGWLGFPLAKKLLRCGYYIKGSTTSPEKIAKLSTAGIKSFCISVTPEGIDGDLLSFLEGSEILILNFPPGSQKQTISQYLQSLQNLVGGIERSQIRKILFISSISVYQDSENFPVYTEEDPPNAVSERGRGLSAAEDLFRNHKGFRTAVLRLGGLIGADRHPVKHLAGRKGVANPEAPINLIHQDDCIGIIEKIIQKKAFGEVYNAVFPEHPPKQLYYSNKAKEKNLPAPGFSDEASKGKVIDPGKITNALEYQFVLGI